MILQNVYMSNARTGEFVIKFSGHLGPVNMVIFAPLAAYPAIRALAGQEPVSLPYARVVTN